MIESKGVKFHSLIQSLKPLGFIDYNKLQIESKVVLSDSGTISEEASILGFKALNIREAHERPEAMEQTAVLMVGLKRELILISLNLIENQYENSLFPVFDYEVNNLSEKILRIIVSYTDYVNRKVWNK
jgi:UDP-N-acetylglucosamine 2-epimerase (non-hydrolysing)